jgi:glycosyltransferase involved in cell wall biosynthesis
MNAVFVIFNLRVGKGGHSFSLNATASTLSRELNNVKVIDISNNDSYVLSSKQSTTYVRLSFAKPITLLKNIRKEIYNEFDVIHCFDDFSYTLVRMAFFGKKLPIILTKCGGGNPKYYYPHSDYLICYSKENYSFFESNVNYPVVDLLPNRLLTQKVSVQTNKLDYLNDFKVNILCISRINDYYEKKICQSINLLKLLVDNGVVASLTIMGTVEDINLYEQLKNLCLETNVVFITEDLFTKKASDYIHYFDCVIGTGRGFMEGAIASKLMFVPTSDTKYPALVQKHNIENYASLNFSQRGIGDTDSSNLVIQFIGLIEDDVKRNAYDVFIKKYSKDHFLIEGVKGEYLELYKQVIVKPNRFKFVNASFGLVYFFYRIVSLKYGFKNPFFKN